MSITLKSRMRYFLMVALIFFVRTLTAKSFDPDSVLKVAESINNKDSVRSIAYYHLSNYYLNDNPRKALHYVNLSITYFAKWNKKDFYYLRYVKKAQIFRSMGNLDSAVHYCNMILNQAIKDKDYFNQNNVYSELGLIANSQDNYKKALHFFEKQIELIKKGLVKDNPASVYNNMGISYASLGESDMAFEYFRRALKHDQIKSVPSLLGNDYNNLGIMFTMKGMLDSAEIYIEKGLQYRRMCNDMLGVGGSLNNLAVLNKNAKKYDQALRLADSAYSIAEKNEFKKLEIEVYSTYNAIYLAKGDYKTAYTYLNNVFREKQKAHRQELTGKVEQLESDIALQEKQAQILEGELQLEKAEKQKQKQTGVILLVSLTLVAALFFAFTFRKKNTQLREQNLLISEQKDIIEEKHQSITDSINYAQKIQSALLISESNLKKSLPSSFILYKPRDIVSGDFYWYTYSGNKHILALADCTGHGVPGAFMSMIGMTLLNKIVNEKNITSPARILNELRTDVINALNLQNSGTDQRDGMDMAIVAFDSQELIYAGANAKSFVVINGAVTDLKPNKQPIGLFERNEPYTEQRLEIEKDMRLFLFSDGIIDQFGSNGEEKAISSTAGKKVRSKLFREWLQNTTQLQLDDQKKEIERLLNDWKKGFEQTDDISLIGVKLG